jgi:hypothetical protein
VRNEKHFILEDLTPSKKAKIKALPPVQQLGREVMGGGNWRLPKFCPHRKIGLVRWIGSLLTRALFRASCLKERAAGVTVITIRIEK